VVDSLNADLAKAQRDFEVGLGAYRNGDQPAARKSLELARETLLGLSGRCLKTRGCEIERVLAAQDAMLAASSKELTSEADGEDNAPKPTAAEIVEPGEASSVAVELPEAARAARLLKGKDLGAIIQLNAPVKSALEDWLTWQRPNLIEAYENYMFMRVKMWPAYEKAGLPEALLFGFLATESGGKVHAFSRAGAAGPLQFMYYTGVRYGLGTDNGFDLRLDPAASARANVAYLNDQLGTLNNNLELALAAYNAGEGRIERLAGGGSRSFWEAPIYYALPPETRNYVPQVLAAAYLFLHPERYNLKFPIIDARTAEITLTAPVSLNELTVCLGQDGGAARGWFRQLRNLNPRQEPNEPIAAGTVLSLPAAAAPSYQRNCIDGQLLAMSADLHSAHPPPVPQAARVAAVKRAGKSRGGRNYTVQKGDTLDSIARQHRCKSVQPIASANKIKAPKYAIKPGQTLVVPACHV
jgi:membrane-bound lytic murein transglycosylase D